MSAVNATNLTSTTARADGPAGARSPAELLRWSQDTVRPSLRAAVDTLPRPVRDIAGYHLGWLDEHGTPTDAGAGKAVRPALALLAAQAVGGEQRVAVPAAVAVELAHNFSLLHDDVMDGDDTRRHRPTAWAVFGAGPAILAGDALLTLALDVLGAAGGPATRSMRMLATAVQELVRGQADDLAFERRDGVTLDECRRMAEGKTGALMGCAAALGALAGGGSLEQIRLLRGFGEHLGLAFQFVDDLLGIWGDPALTGKPVYSDLRSRKKSLPVVATLRSSSGPGRALTALYAREQPLTDGELRRAADLIDEAGARHWSQASADDLLERALGQLGAAGPAPRAAAELTTLAGLITRRDR